MATTARAKTHDKILTVAEIERRYPDECSHLATHRFAAGHRPCQAAAVRDPRSTTATPTP